jgi:transposase
VEQFERIRREHRDEGLSIRALADRHNVHRRTVRRAIADAVPPVRKPSQRQAPVLGRYESTIKRWLIEDLDAPRKQRHTARRIWQRLVEEEGAVVAESSVRNLVAQLRTEISPGQQVMVPQTHPPAEEAICGVPHIASYAAPGNMRRVPESGRGSAAALPLDAGVIPHIHRPSRNSRIGSGGRYRPAGVFGGAVRARAFSLRLRSAWR